jgi:glucose-6-phosphate 1-epimerase
VGGVTAVGALPQVSLALPAGDTVRIARHGAQVLSWKTADGLERLYLSPRATLDGRCPIRGGVPVCFPQFNQRVLGTPPLPKHGFARSLTWQLDSRTVDGESATAVLSLGTDEHTLALWPQAFSAQLQVRLAPGQVRITANVRNAGLSAWPFALALHTYLRVASIARSTLRGLQGCRYWDAVTDPGDSGSTQAQPQTDLAIVGETDRVYSGAGPLRLVQVSLGGAASELLIEQSPSFSETVVWNPGAAACAGLADMPAKGFEHMVCVEAAKINRPVMLEPGASWSGWQQLSVIGPGAV